MSQGRDAKIVLGNGVEFFRAEERIREYRDIEVYRDIGYRGGYDDHHNVTDVVTRDDLEGADNLYAQMSSLDRERILRDRRIPPRLAAVGDKELGEMTDEEWEGVKALLRPLLSEFLSIPNVSLAKATKVLHLKRPHLFPILDFLVVKFLTGNDMKNNWFTEDELLQIGLSAFETVRLDVITNRAQFAELQRRLSDLPTPLTVVRMHDILCWTQEKWVNGNNPSAKYGTASKSLDQAARAAEVSPPANPAPAVDVGKPLEKPQPSGEIGTLKEFRQIVGRAEGVIVITGTTPARAHRALCDLVTDDRFNENVILSGSKGVKYYWRGSLIEARRDFGAVPCKRCRPSESVRPPSER